MTPAPPPPGVVVLDTNVFVAAGFRAGSHAARVVEGVRAGRLRMAWSEATRGETERVVRRIPPLSWEEFAGLFRDGERVEVSPSAADGFEIVADAEDRKFAALAEAAGAVLVTNDAHLLSARAALRAPVLTPREFVERMGEREPGEGELAGRGDAGRS